MMNGLFQSPYWPANNNWDNRWGAFGFWQVVAWPIQRCCGNLSGFLSWQSIRAGFRSARPER